MSTKSQTPTASFAGIAVVTIAILLVAYIAQDHDAGGQSVGRPGVNAEGRFQIVMRDGLRVDTFLLDTQEGRVWQLTEYTDGEGTPTVWNLMGRIDSHEDLLRLPQKK